MALSERIAVVEKNFVEVRARLRAAFEQVGDGLRRRVAFATRAELNEISAKLDELSKKIDALVKRRTRAA
jgi:hypothetical protein